MTWILISAPYPKCSFGEASHRKQMRNSTGTQPSGPCCFNAFCLSLTEKMQVRNRPTQKITSNALADFTSLCFLAKYSETRRNTLTAPRSFIVAAKIGRYLIQIPIFNITTYNFYTIKI